MRILHVIGSLDPEAGGPPEICASLAAAQASLGHAVTVAAAPGPRDGLLLGDVPGFAGVRRAELPPSSSSLHGLAGLLTARAKLGAAVAGHDVVHLHNVWEGILPAAAAACRRLATPYVVSVNGMLDGWSLAQSAVRKRIAMASTHRAMLRHAAAFHCGNDYEASVVAALRLGPPARIVPNGVWLERVDHGRASALPAALDAAIGGAPFVLFLGRLHRKKGLDFLLAAFDVVAAARRDVKLVIAGPDDGESRRVRRYAAGPNGGRVVPAGPLYGDAKFAAFARASVFCLPSRQEGFPVAALEALGSGTPVVLSEHCHLPEAAVAGAVVPLDADRLAEALLRVLASPDPHGDFGRHGRALVASSFTWPSVAEASLAMYDEVLRR